MYRARRPAAMGRTAGNCGRKAQVAGMKNGPRALGGWTEGTQCVLVAGAGDVLDDIVDDGSPRRFGPELTFGALCSDSLRGFL